MKEFRIGQTVYQRSLFDVNELKIVAESNCEGRWLVENSEGKQFYQDECDLFVLKSSAYAETLAEIKHRLEIAKKDCEWEKGNLRTVKIKLLQEQKNEKGCK